MKQGASTLFVGIRTLTAGTVLIQAGRLLVLLVLSRWLPPSEFGILSLATAIVGFSSFFVDAGVSNVFYREEVTDEAARSSLFWLNIVLGVAMCCLIVVVSPMIAGYYDIPALKPVLNLTSLSLIFTALAAQHRVHLRRMMRFDQLIRIDAVSFGVNAAVTLIGAWYGAGVFAMVAGTVLGNMVATMGYLLAGGKAWLPRCQFSYVAIKPHLGFGMYQMGERLSNFLAERADVFIIGKVLGPGPLGLYDVLKQLLSRTESIVNPIVSQATLPVMARKHHNLLFVKVIYLKSLELSNTLNITVYGLVICMPTAFLSVVAGPQWAGETAVLIFLAAYYIIHASFNPVGSLLLAKGRADLGFWWNIAMLLLTPPIVWAGTKGGTVGVALALVGMFVCLAPFLFLFLIRPLSGARWAEYLRTLFRPLLMVLVCGAAAFVVSTAFPLPPLAALLLFTVLYLPAIWWWLGRYNRNIFRLLRKTVSGGNK